ncbi:MAG: Bbp16 family capsid cement protein [Bacteriovoracaceae bacterium]
MIIDIENVFSEHQAVTATAASTNVVDLGAKPNQVQADVEKGRMSLLVQITEAFDNLTDLKISFETDDAENFGTAEEVASKTVVLADLTLGKKVYMAIVPGLKRYIRMNYTVNGVAPTVGKVYSALVFDDQLNGV